MDKVVVGMSRTSLLRNLEKRKLALLVQRRAILVGGDLLSASEREGIRRIETALSAVEEKLFKYRQLKLFGSPDRGTF